MLFEQVKKGMKVRINKIRRTQDRFGVNDNMKGMVGSIYLVQSIRVISKTVQVSNWNWDADDLSPTDQEDIPPIPPEMFDPRDLVI